MPSNSLSDKSGFSPLTLFKLLIRVPDCGEALLWLSLASLLINIFSLAVPLFFMQIYDRILVYSGLNTLVWLTTVIIIVLIINGFVTVIRGKLAGNYAGRFAFLQEMRLMDSIFSVPEDMAGKLDTADLDDKFRSINQLKGFYAGAFFQSLLDLPFISLFFLAAYYLGGALVFFHISVLLLFIALQFFYSLILNRWNRNVVLSRIKRLAFLREFLEQIHIVKAQSYEEVMLRKLDHLQEDLTDEERKLLHLRQFARFSGDILSQTLIYGTIIIGGYFVLNGSLSIGVVTAITMISRRMITPLQSFNHFTLRLAMADYELKQIDLNIEGDPVDFRPLNLDYQLTGNIELRDLKYGTLDINLKIARREMCLIQCFDGDGAGEQLLGLLQGIRKPESGKIIVDNYILSNHSGLYVSPQYAVLSRNTRLFNGTILDNITYFDPNLHVQALDAAALLDLDKNIAAFPKGYETELGTYSNNIMSTGLLQRIALARVLVYRPRILICHRIDDLMDSESFGIYMDILKGLKGNTTLLIFSSKEEMKQLADKVYRLSEGRLYEQ